MIFTDSRYANGSFYNAHDARTNNYYLGVKRNFPTYSTSFVFYQWKEQDRLDLIATNYLGLPTHWWKILDINPEISDPFNIPVGTTIRIPVDR